MMMMMFITIFAGDDDDDDDVYYYKCQRLKLEGETENMCVWTKKNGRGRWDEGERDVGLRETLVCIRKTATRHKRGE